MILYLFLLNKGRYVVLFLNKGVWGYLKKNFDKWDGVVFWLIL